MRRAMLVLVILAAVFAPLRAQDSIQLPEDCKPETVKTWVDALKKTTDSMAEAVQGDTFDSVQVLDKFEAIKEVVGMLRAQCDNLAFRGEGSKVVGPFQIPKGVYRAFVRTEDFVIVNITAVDGNCGQGSGSYLSKGLFSADKDEATKGTEALLTSEGCSAILDFQMVGTPWVLTFERLT